MSSVVNNFFIGGGVVAQLQQLLQQLLQPQLQPLLQQLQQLQAQLQQQEQELFHLRREVNQNDLMSRVRVVDLGRELDLLQEQVRPLIEAQEGHQDQEEDQDQEEHQL